MSEETPDSEEVQSVASTAMFGGGFGDLSTYLMWAAAHVASWVLLEFMVSGRLLVGRQLEAGKDNRSLEGSTWSDTTEAFTGSCECWKKATSFDLSMLIKVQFHTIPIWLLS
jgi:hypothetical protein